MHADAVRLDETMLDLHGSLLPRGKSCASQPTDDRRPRIVHTDQRSEEREMSSSPLGSQAVVIGAGMGGLAAAAALADHFGRVTVLDRDFLPPTPSHRSGTPQSRHLHVLLGGGLQALCELLPGFEEDLIRAGAV